jgi:hypothetical protein
MKAARIIVAAHALLIVAWHWSLPSLFTWPRELWAGAPPRAALRYLWLFPPRVEAILYMLLALALLCALLGAAARVSCFAAAILLYHFAPLQDVFINASGPFAGGLTVDVLALVILAAAPEGRRWPPTLIRAAVASQYLFSTVAKLRIAGIGWFGGDNIRDMAILFDRLGLAPYARVVAAHPALAWSIGIGWLLITLGMAAAPFSRPAARIFVPLAALAHVAAVPLFGIVYPGAPLLLLFVDWPQRGVWGRRPRRPAPPRAAAPHEHGSASPQRRVTPNSAAQRVNA